MTNSLLLKIANLYLIYLLETVIFHSYVSWPEAKWDLDVKHCYNMALRSQA